MNPTDRISIHIGHVVEVEVTETVQTAIDTARRAREGGRSKVDTVRQIYPAISSLPKEAIWYCFIHGVDLSSRGAVTYYYNILRESNRRW